MAKILRSLIKPKKQMPHILNFRLSKAELAEIREKAKKYTRGNVTALARIALKSFKPRSRDLVEVK